MVIDLNAERWEAERKCLLDEKQGPLMDERRIGCQDGGVRGRVGVHLCFGFET